MGRPMKKNKVGGAAVFVSRKQALKKLQLSLKDFRRLCILKGIYPVEPKRRMKISGGNSTIKTYYHMKDVQYLMHEPIIRKFREHKIFVRRLRKAMGKKQPEKVDALRACWPKYKLDHIVKERYPSFQDAVRDMDDALTMCFLIARLPKGRLVKLNFIQLCRRLTLEFMQYIIHSRSLRKVFISIKGIYYQADICGETVTWVVPHNLGYQPPSEVDFKIMMTFTHFYSTMLGFINYRLFGQINLIYPPKLANETQEAKDSQDSDGTEVPDWLDALNHALKNVSSDTVEDIPDELPDLGDAKLKESKNEMVKLQEFQDLFKGLKFFLNREVPRESLVFVIRSFGGDVSWCKTICDGATFDETDETITHQIVDRPLISNQYLNRFYVQPQWVFDSINNLMLLPVQKYFAGVPLPPHLSPFVEEKEGEYVPPEKVQLQNIQEGTVVEELPNDEQEEVEEEEGAVSENEEPSDRENLKKEVEEKRKKAVITGKVELTNPVVQAKKEADEEKRLAVMMIPKKQKRLYNKIMFGQKRRAKEANLLKSKREEYEKNVKRKKVRA